MAIQCPQVGPFYRPNAQPGDTITLDIIDDLNISDTNNENVFFTSGLIERGDDVGSTTFFPTAQVPGGFRNAGSITNTGTQISYTVDNTMEPGDCILIQYTASNTLEQPDSDCTQTFEICFASGPAQPPDNVLPCLDGETILPNGVLVLSTSQLSSVTQPLVFDLVFVTNSNGQTVQVPQNDNSSALDFSNLPSGVYTVNYRLRNDDGDVSEQCRIFFSVAGEDITCLSGVTVRFSDVGLTIEAGDLSNRPNATFTRVQMIDNAGNLDGLRWSGSTITVDPTELQVGQTYSLSYALSDGEQECSAIVTYLYDTSVQTGNFTGNSLDCSRTRWLNGTPQITCGAAASDHVAELYNRDGSPFLQANPNLEFAQNQFPDGVVVSVVSIAGNQYTFRIDPSNAECSGTINASIGV